MSRQIRIVAGVLLLSASLSPAAEPLRRCDCSETFTDLTAKLERNYIGLEQRRPAEYETRRATFAARARSTDAKGCTRLLRQFVAVFDDGHLFVFERPEYDAAELDAFRNAARRDTPGVDELNRLLSQDAPPDGLVGRWTDGSSEIAIVRRGETYRSHLLDSRKEDARPGELKAVLAPFEGGLEGTFYAYSHAPRYVTAALHKQGTLLDFGSGILWGRLVSPYAREIAAIDRDDPGRPTIARLDEKSTLLSIPSFLMEFNEFREFISEHRKVLENSRHLLIDIRGNSGGNAVYFPVLELFATRNLPGNQGSVLASEENLAYFRARAAGSRLYKQVVKEIERAMGTIVDGPAYPGRRFKPARNSIESVSILADGGCMSAAESFVLHAKQVSDKVTTFGSPTAGVIDYTSVNLLPLASGSRNIFLGYPTSSFDKDVPRKGHNATGILPDRPIDRGVADKVGFILEALRSVDGDG